MAKDLYVKGYGDDSKDKRRLSRRHAFAIGMAFLVILAVALGWREWQRRSQFKPPPVAGHKVTRGMPVPTRPAEVKDSRSSSSASKKNRAQLTELRLAMEAEAPPLTKKEKAPTPEIEESERTQVARVREPHKKVDTDDQGPQAQKEELGDTIPDADELSSESPQEGYVIQVGAFRRLKAAKNIQKRLMEKGYESYLDARDLPDLGLVHRVRIRGYDSVDAAKEDMKRIRKEEGLSSFVFKLEPDKKMSAKE